MAILKAINVKNADRKRFLEALDYVSNPAKNSDTKLLDKAKKFEMVTLVNRKLYGQEDCKRQFKQYIISMENEWPDNPCNRERFNKAFSGVVNECEMYFMNQGYMASGYIHCNTNHPHCHILLETCNGINGKQYTESQSDLANFKKFVSSILLSYGFDEKILIEVKFITEEELFQEEQSDIISDDKIDSVDKHCKSSDDGKENFTSEILPWNIGTMEHSRTHIPQRVMCLTVAPEQKKEMCKIVPQNKKKIMCNIISHK